MVPPATLNDILALTTYEMDLLDETTQEQYYETLDVYRDRLDAQVHVLLQEQVLPCETLIYVIRFWTANVYDITLEELISLVKQLTRLYEWLITLPGKDTTHE